MEHWNLDGIKTEDRRAFIIQCLQGYIDEVESMGVRNSSRSHDIEICEIADFYKGVIEELST